MSKTNYDIASSLIDDITENFNGTDKITSWIKSPNTIDNKKTSFLKLYPTFTEKKTNNTPNSFFQNNKTIQEDINTNIQKESSINNKDISIPKESSINSKESSINNKDISIPKESSINSKESSINSKESSIKKYNYKTILFYLFLFIFILIFISLGYNIYLYNKYGIEGVYHLYKPLFILYESIYEKKEEKEKEEEKKDIHNTLKNDKIQEDTYTADEIDSNIQSKNKSGYCFIGEEHSNRVCAYASKNTKCLSGDIFPTLEKCINPNIRV